MVRFQESVRSVLRERLLDAACERLAASDWAGLRMVHVAAVAGVSRQTVYNEFGSKPAMGQAIVDREIERLLLGLQDRVDDCGGDPVAAVEAAVEHTLKAVAASPLLKTILTTARGGENDPLSHLTIGADPVLPGAIAMLRSYADERWPEVDAEAKDLVIETLIRATLSHVVIPLGTPEETARRFGRLATRVLEGAPSGWTPAISGEYGTVPRKGEHTGGTGASTRGDAENGRPVHRGGGQIAGRRGRIAATDL